MSPALSSGRTAELKGESPPSGTWNSIANLTSVKSGGGAALKLKLAPPLMSKASFGPKVEKRMISPCTRPTPLISMAAARTICVASLFIVTSVSEVPN
jgi:hypothetical protein